MFDTIAALVRAMLVTLGLLALVDPASSGAVVAIAVIAIAAALIIVAAVTATSRAHAGATTHPTRRAELCAPLAQSDPDAAGHVRRRGPGQALAAA